MQTNDSYFIHESAYEDEGCEIGAGTRIWHFSHLMHHCKIGRDCVVGQNVMIGPYVILGNNVKVQNNVSIYEGVIIGDDVFLGPSMVFTNVINPRSAISRKDAFKPTIVQRGASIGANATIICGNTIGEYAFVGAGAVVTKPVEAYALITGNPGIRSGWISEYGNPLQFSSGNIATCGESGQQYFLENGTVKRIS